MNSKRTKWVFFCGLFLTSGLLRADEVVWMSAPADNVWSTGALNWNAGEAWPVGSGHTAVFGVSAQQTLSVGEALSVGAIRFQADGYQIAGQSLTFTGATPFLAVESASVTSLLETAIFNNSLLTKTGPGVLRLGAAAYDAGATNVRDVAISAGVLRVEAGRTLCSTGTWSVAGGAAYEQTGGTNILLSGGDILVLGAGGEAGQTARFEVTGGVWHAKATRVSAGENSRVVLGRDQNAWLRIAGSADVWAVVLEMNELAAAKSATLQLDGGTLTVARMTGFGGINSTLSRILLNGTEIRPVTANSAFISGMTEALVQAGGLVLTIPSSFFKTPQLLEHDSALGTLLDGGVVKRGPGALHLQNSNTYTGTNRIEQGTVVAEADQALGYGPIEVGLDGSIAALAAAEGSHTLTNRITFGMNGSACAATNATLTLADIGFVADQEQLKIYGTQKAGTVRLAIDPASTTRVYNVFVYDKNNLILDGGTVIRQLVPVPGGATPCVEVRVGSVMTVRDADIQMPDLSYLLLGGGEYRQEGGIALFPQVWSSTNWPNSNQREVPSRVIVAGGELNFTSLCMYSNSSRRATETIINGGVLKTAQLNLSKPAGANASLTHRVELNGGVLEVGQIRYDGGVNAVEPATVLFNGGTLKPATDTAYTNDFITINGLNLLSLYLGAGGLVCDTAGKDLTIRQPMRPAPDLGNATDGGILKTGAGRLALVHTVESDGPVVVAEGELTLFDLRLANTNVSVAAGASLTLCGGTLSNVVLDVQSGGTLALSSGSAMEQVTNGSFETNTVALSPGYAYFTAASTNVPGWTFLPDLDNQVGIQKNGGSFSNPLPTTTNGNATAMIKKGTVKTTISIPWEGMYQLRFEHAMRYNQSTAPTVDVLVDNIPVHQIVYPGYLHGYEAVTVLVALSQGTHEIAFKGYASGNPAVFIDAVSLTRVPGILVTGAASELHVATGATLVLDNESPLYIEHIYVNGQRVYTMDSLQQNGVTVEGAGHLKTAPGGTVIQVR